MRKMFRVCEMCQPDKADASVQLPKVDGHQLLKRFQKLQEIE